MRLFKRKKLPKFKNQDEIYKLWLNCGSHDCIIIYLSLVGNQDATFSAKYFFSQKLSEIFQLCKVHVFAKLLGHILTFKKIIFHI